MNKKVVILGAGLTGLTTAFYLKQKGIDFVVLEKMSRTGGVMNTEENDGFVYETGANSGTISFPEVVELFEDLDFLDYLETAHAVSDSRLIWYKNRWEALPIGFWSAVKTPLFTWKDKIRILFEPFRKKGTNPNETLADLVKRRLGKSFLENAVDPFLGGIYAGNPSQIITKYALPKLYNLEQNYGSFIVGAFKKSKEPKTDRDKKVTKDIFSVKGGFRNLIERLTEKIGHENIILNAQNIEVHNLGDKKYQISFNEGNEKKEINSEYVITTIPAPFLTDVLPFIEKKHLEQITKIRYAPVVQVSVLFDKWEGMPLNAFGGLIPSRYKSDILGILFPSSIFKNRANKGGVVLSVFMGGIRKKEVYEYSDEKIKEILAVELTKMLKITNYNPKYINIYRYKNAIPQYELGTYERLNTVQYLENKYLGLFLSGNLKDGVGMGHRIKQAVDVANIIAETTDK